MSTFRILAVVALLAVLSAFALMLAAANLEIDSYQRGNYALDQCWPRAGDWPEHGDDCE